MPTRSCGGYRDQTWSLIFETTSAFGNDLWRQHIRSHVRLPAGADMTHQLDPDKHLQLVVFWRIERWQVLCLFGLTLQTGYRRDPNWVLVLTLSDTYDTWIWMMMAYVFSCTFNRNQTHTQTHERSWAQFRQARPPSRKDSCYPRPTNAWVFHPATTSTLITPYAMLTFHNGSHVVGPCNIISLRCSEFIIFTLFSSACWGIKSWYYFSRPTLRTRSNCLLQLFSLEFFYLTLSWAHYLEIVIFIPTYWALLSHKTLFTSRLGILRLVSLTTAFISPETTGLTIRRFLYVNWVY